MTVSIDDFVKAIYNQSLIAKADTRLSTIARRLNISNAAATDMARKLAAKGFVKYVKYKPLGLTGQGRSLALNVIRKHRLWESFLDKTLNLSLYEIHREAEKLEHFTSDYLANKIEQYLGNPATDPQGDPIPSLDGHIECDNSQMLLSKAEAGANYEVSRLYGYEEDFFDFCISNGLIIGAKIWIEKQYPKEKMTEVQIEQSKLLLHEEFTNKIYVKQLK